MGRQSSRIYFQGKDHKEIFFRGHYHDVMYIGGKLVWKKLTEIIDKYWVYTSVSGNGSIAIIKPLSKTRKYWSFQELLPKGMAIDKSYFTHDNNNFVYMGRITNEGLFMGGFLISKDGVSWKADYINRKLLGYFIYSIVPKWDGLIFANNTNPINDNPSNAYEYRYCPIKNGVVDQENSILIYSDNGTYTSMTIEQTTNFPDVLILFDTLPVDGRYKAFAVDNKGNVYKDLFSVNSYGDIHPHGCFNGMYWMINDIESESIPNTNNYNIYANVYKTNNPYDKWDKKRIFNYTKTPSELYYSPVITATQAKDYIVLYIFTSRTYRDYTTKYTTDIYKTTDFLVYEKINHPDSLLIPIIGESYDSEKKYVKFLLNWSDNYIAREDSYYTSIIQWNPLYKKTLTYYPVYAENGKIAPFEGILHKIDVCRALIYSEKEITVYIDNLFYQESENSFAICESLYPNG